METTYWHKQGSEPLFPELEWNKPERRDQAGRLLIVGGSTHALNAPAKAYELVKKQGIGAAKIVLPDKTKRLVGATLPDAVFLPSTTSGEFSQEGTEELLGYAQWADTVLLAGDIARNSQTTILFESFLRSYNGEVVLTKDVIESLGNHPQTILEREHTTLIASFSQLQHLMKNAHQTTPLQFSMGIVPLVSYLHGLTTQHPIRIATLHEQQIICAANGQVSTTKITHNTPDLRKTSPLSDNASGEVMVVLSDGGDAVASLRSEKPAGRVDGMLEGAGILRKSGIPEPPPWRLHYASLASCYLTWYPRKPFESLAHATHQYITHP